MRLHFKIDPEKLSENGFLLDDNALATVNKIKVFVKGLANDSAALRNAKDELLQIDKQLCFVNDPYQAIDSLLIPKENETELIYSQRVLRQLKEWEKEACSSDTIDFIRALQNKYSLTDKHDYETYYDYLNEIWQYYESDAQDLNLRRRLEDTRDKLIEKIDSKESQLKEAINNFKNENQAIFDLDDDYRLIKISKKSLHLPFSVLYITQNDETQPIALYPGKDGQILGEGGFGRVKLGQNIITGEWIAVKIQQHFMQGPSQNENQILRDFNRFKGDARREHKYYSAQTLIHGNNLYEYLQTHPDTLFEKRLIIAKKAALLVEKFHNTHLHRDLKPENFIWDEETNELYLCDFGMSLELGEDQTSVLGLSGSGTYLAPEIDGTKKGSVNYTKKSDIYALGKVFETIFQETNSIPDELSKLIQNMTEHAIENRLESAKEAEVILSQIIHQNFQLNSDLRPR